MLVTDIAITFRRESPAVSSMLVKKAIMKRLLVKYELSMVELAGNDKVIST